jgi:hypothetical protein
MVSTNSFSRSSLVSNARRMTFALLLVSQLCLERLGLRRFDPRL